jgi:hypothetical protein
MYYFRLVIRSKQCIIDSYWSYTLNCDVQDSNIICFNGLNLSVIQEAVCRKRWLKGQTGNVPMNVTLRRVCATIVVMEKAIIINIF